MNRISQYLYNFYPLYIIIAWIIWPCELAPRPQNSGELWRCSRVAPLEKPLEDGQETQGICFQPRRFPMGFPWAGLDVFKCVGSCRLKLASSWNCWKESWEHVRVSLKLPPVFSSMTDVAGPMEVGSCNAWKSRLMFFFPGKLSCF